jgi:hypothetical protein
MQKWEYLIVSFLTTGSEGLEGYIINGKYIPRKFGLDTAKSYPAFVEFRHQLLNEWGSEGWELVTETSADSIFKRPKS